MPVISTGQLTIVDVTDGINARLSNETHVVPEVTSGESLDLSGATTTMSVYFGATDDSNNWQFSVASAVGLTGQLTGQTYQVTSLLDDVGYVDIAASRVGFSTITSRFSVAKAKRGEPGQDGGAGIELVASNPGFFFQDNLPNPASQSIAFDLIRNGATEPVIFFASDNLSLQSSNELTAVNFAIGVPDSGKADRAYLDLSTFGSRKKVVVTAVCGGQSASQTIIRLNESTAAAGATKNVSRGAWSSANVPYVVGDSVAYQGSTYACILDHFSSTLNAPPDPLALSNSYWILQSAKGEQGNPGAAGDPGYAYNMLTTAAAVQRNAAGVYSPATVTFIGYRSIGASVATYPARFTVETTTNGTDFVVQYTSAVDESSCAFTVPANVVAIRAKMYLAGGTSVLVDEELIPVVVDGSNAVSVTLSNESVALAADANGTVSSYAGAGTDIYVFEGTTAYTYVGSLTGNNQFTVSAAASGVTAGAITASGSGTNRAVVAAPSSMTGDTASITFTITARKSDGTTVTFTKQQSLTKAKSGAGAVTCVLTNESQALPASNTGVVSSYAGSGTDIYVYEGNTALTYVSTITANNQFSIAVSAAGITAGAITASGSGTARAIVADHSNMTTNSATITYTITARKADGTTITIVKRQSLTKSLAGADGSAASASFVTLNVNKQTFTYTDGVANPTTQADITFSLVRSNVGSGAATFTASPGVTLGGTGDTRTLSLANFGTNREVVVTVSVTFNSIVYTDRVTIVRLDASTAAAGATVGATIGVNLGGQINSTNVSTFIANAAIQSAQIGDAQITSAKIGDAQITSAKIANSIQSNNYAAGSTGWIIDKTGNMEINSATFRGTIDVKNAASGARLEIKNNVIKVFDANNVLRVRIGDLAA